MTALPTKCALSSGAARRDERQPITVGSWITDPTCTGVEAIGGCMAVRDQAGCGCVFTVTFRACPTR